MIFKDEAGTEFVAATIPGTEFVAATIPATVIGNPSEIGNCCGFIEWTYNPKENGEILTPPPNVNVYVREEKIWVMGQQRDLQPIRIRIEIW